MNRVRSSLVALSMVAAGPLLAAACGSDSDGGGGPGGSAASGGSAGAGGSSGGTGGSGATGAIGFDASTDSGGCVDGQACGNGGICAGGVCCDSALACGATCCNSGQVCSFAECKTPGKTCVDRSDCAADEYCEFSLGDEADGGAPDGGSGDSGDGGTCVGGASFKTGRCLKKPPTCGPGQNPGTPPTCLAECQFKPPATAFNPDVKFSWGGQTTSPFASDVMMTPIVIQLDDDDCDGKITDRDIPEVVFSTFSNGSYETNGVVHAISVVNGAVVDKWSLPGVVNPTKHLAGGNVDGKPGNEVIGCGTDGKAHAIDGAGKVVWSSAVMPCFMPSIADLDQDGDVEVIVEGGILDGVTGNLEHAYSAPLAGPPVVSDIDADGKLDVVTSSQGFDASGQLFVDTGLANTGSFPDDSDWKGPWPAVADFDKDGKPEVVAVHNLNHELSIWRYDAPQTNKFTVVRGPVDINGSLPTSNCSNGTWGNTHGGGPPTIADFNGDGTPDVALAGGVGYAVLDGVKLIDSTVTGPNTFLWVKDTTDCSSASTGSTVFDFNGDGVSEVIYSDELRLRIYDGPTGNVLFETCNTTATLIENPVVADVDNDGHADIVAVSNAYGKTCDSTKQSGIRIFGDTQGKWVRTRRVWNEHAYHVTNVNEDGSIPQQEAANYSSAGLNNFRQNKQPGGEFSAPDAVVTIAPKCAGEYGLLATVQNIGEAALPAGVVVGFYEGSGPPGTPLGKQSTTRVLYSLDSETLFLPLSSTPSGTVFAIVDDTTTPHPEWTECRTDNNQSKVVSPSCNVPR